MARPDPARRPRHELAHGLPVSEMILSRLPVTAELTLGAMLVALATGVPLGILSARRENTTLDHVVRVASLFSLSIPVFWQATMLILAVSLWLGWAPSVAFVGPSPTRGEPPDRGAPERGPRDRGGRGVHAHDAVVAPRGDAPGLRPDGAGQGARRARRRVGPRAQERPHPPDHGGGRADRLPPGRRGRNRGSLHPARDRAAPPVGGRSSATTRWCRGRSCSSACFSCFQPRGRSRVCLHRPAIRYG